MKLLTKLHKVNQKCGFTFIELILVVAIILILSTMSTSFYSSFLTQNAVANATDQIVGQLRKAQIYAMLGKQNSNWGVIYSDTTIILYQGESFASRNAALDENFSVPASVSISGFSETNFVKATGIPNATPTITISDSNNNSKTVTVNGFGVVERL